MILKMGLVTTDYLDTANCHDYFRWKHNSSLIVVVITAISYDFKFLTSRNLSNTMAELLFVEAN
jgi:hypothetical protein